MSKKQDWENWVASRPEKVKKLIAEFPPGEYVMLPGAPYGVSTPGTIVILRSYQENGEVSIIVPAENKTPKAIEHESYLGMMHNKTQEEIEKIHKSNIQVIIDPKYMELVKAYNMED